MRQLAKLLSRFVGSEGSNPSLSAIFPLLEAPLLPALKGRKVLVMGLGSFGGGVGCARTLAEAGALVTVTDLRPANALKTSLDQLQDLSIRYALGGHDEDLFANADWVVVNPAVPPHSPWLKLARAQGCRLTTEINLALAACPPIPTVAITGTHGKSTCAALCAHLLAPLQGHTLLAGNLGGSLLQQVQQLQTGDRLVVELSSFQLERLCAPPGWPHIAILTSLDSDHLDWHGSLSAYHQAKRNLLAKQTPPCTLLLGIDGDAAQPWKEGARGQVVELAGMSLQELGLADTDLPFTEPYRLPSLLAAIHAARLLGIEDANLHAQLQSFPGLAHRMQIWVDPHGRHIIDNGVATHPGPTTAALQTIEGPVVLLAGGKDKGLDLAELSRTCRLCRRLYLHGEGGERLAITCHQQGVEALWFPQARQAMEAALKHLKSDEKLLFSPTFSSYDEFLNFRQRAEFFRSLCAAIPVMNSEEQA